MKKIILLLLIIPVFAFGQRLERTLFAAGADTVAEHDSQDTVAVRIGGPGGWGPYINLTQEVNSSVYITAAEKAAETPNIYNLASESWWTYIQKIQVRITSPSDVATSRVHTISQFQGAITIIIVPDTVTTDTYTDYSASTIIGM